MSNEEPNSKDIEQEAAPTQPEQDDTQGYSLVLAGMAARGLYNEIHPRPLFNPATTYGLGKIRGQSGKT